MALLPLMLLALLLDLHERERLQPYANVAVGTQAPCLAHLPLCLPTKLPVCLPACLAHSMPACLARARPCGAACLA